MARFITFNGVTIVHPGGISKVTSAGLPSVGATATGIVAIIGEADGGQPNKIEDTADPNYNKPKIYSFSEPSLAKDVFRSGELADAIGIAFDPSNDFRVPGGAQRVLAVKTNMSTSSTLTLKNQTNTDDVVLVRSRDYGLHTENITVEVEQNGTDNDTVDITITNNDSGLIESLTGKAGKPLMNVQFKGPDVPYVRMTAGASGVSTFDGTTVTCVGETFTTASVNEGNWIHVTAAPVGSEFMINQFRRIETVTDNTNLEIDAAFIDNTDTAISAGAAEGPDAAFRFNIVRGAIGPFSVTTVNVAKTVLTFDKTPTATGISNRIGAVAGATSADRYDLATSGPNFVRIISGPGQGEIRDISAAGLSGADLEITVSSAFTNITTASRVMFINASKSGGAPATGGAFATITGDTGAAALLTLRVRPGFGESNGAGGVITDGGATAVATDYTFALSSVLSVGTLVDRIKAGNSPVSGPLVSDAGGWWHAQVGPGRSTGLATSRFDFVVTGGTAGTDTDDTNNNVDALQGFDQQFSGTFLGGSAVKPHRLFDNLEQIIETVNASSTLVSMTKETGAGEGDGVPLFTTTPQYLTNGSLGTSSNERHQKALDELIKHRHNTVVSLFSSTTGTPAVATVAAQLAEHVDLGAGAGKNECDAVIGYSPPTAAGALTETTTFRGTVANKNLAVVFQQPDRLDVSGNLKTMAPHMMAVIVAGMQAGAPLGEPLTFKRIKASALDQPVLMDPLDRTTADTLLLNAVLFAEPVEGGGFRIVDNLSTYTADDNVLFTDRHTNYILNHIKYDMRTAVESAFTGLKATPATVVSLRDFVISRLDRYKLVDEIITNSVDSAGNVLNAWSNVRITISGVVAAIRFQIFPVLGIKYQTTEIFAQIPTLTA